MSSPHNSYIFPRPSTLATRSLISDNNDTPTLHQENDTDHYERAAAEAAKTDTSPSTVAAVGTQKQQSWKMSDLKSQRQGEVIDGKAGGMGYSTTMMTTTTAGCK